MDEAIAQALSDDVETAIKEVSVSMGAESEFAGFASVLQAVVCAERSLPLCRRVFLLPPFFAHCKTSADCTIFSRFTRRCVECSGVSVSVCVPVSTLQTSKVFLCVCETVIGRFRLTFSGVLDVCLSVCLSVRLCAFNR